jgi:hypothetical protein
MAKANHTSAEENNSPSSLRRLPTKKLSMQAVLEVVLVALGRLTCRGLAIHAFRQSALTARWKILGPPATPLSAS